MPATTPAEALPTARGTKVHWTGEDHRTGDHADCAPWVRAIRQAHLDNPTEHWVDIAYNLLACPHGYVFEGRGAGYRSGANGNIELNDHHYAICALIGKNTAPNPELLTALRDGIEYLQQHGAGAEILGHKDGYATDCPGSALYQWVHAGAPRPGGAPPPPARPGPPWPFPRGVFFHLQTPYQRDDRLKPWQRQLVDHGYNLGPAGADGVFGPYTARALDRLQAESFPPGPKRDGWLGPESWAAAWGLQ
jgi:hypothetical protein